MNFRRRDFITLLGGAAAWPLAARAQQPALQVIGYLSSRTPDDTAHLVAAFRRGLSETGYVEGRNVTVEYRWGFGQYDRLPALAAELARAPVAVLASSGGDPAILAAKAATSTIPIVFVGGDPVQMGLAASFNRPGGNVTGISTLSYTLVAKRLGLLHELVSQAAAIGLLVNPADRGGSGAQQTRELQEATRTIGLQIHVLQASTDSEIDTAFESLAQGRIAALIIGSDPFYDTRRDKLVGLAARKAVPAMYQSREYAAAGGLISYGVDFSESYRQLGVYTGRILKGEKPADLPIVQSTKFELVINLKTAKALGLTIPPSVSAIADEVIE
jgi:putative tryptophan/tyrosine transport system substrate-binding protein